jgi:hypothetical protein
LRMAAWRSGLPAPSQAPITRPWRSTSTIVGVARTRRPGWCEDVVVGDAECGRTADRRRARPAGAITAAPVRSCAKRHLQERLGALAG